MKKLVSTIIAVLACAFTSAQTLNVQVGEVVYQVPAAQLVDDYKDMVYVDGSQVTIYGKTFTIADIDRIYINGDAVTDNTVTVAYDGDAATVKVAGNAMRFLDVTADGADVAISQHDDLAEELSYVLSGESDNGSFYMDGSYKASVVLNGITLTSTTGAAVTIKNGKRISIELTEGTVNTFVDSEGGDQKACIHVKGHTELKGGGTLNITGRSAHAFWGKEYVEVKKTAGTINILGAVGDGFNVNQYFQMNGGTVNISGVGDDGIQVSYKTDDDDNIEVDDENTGEAIIKGGTLTISAGGTDAKGIKSEGELTILGGTVSVANSGAMSKGLKSETTVAISGGSVTLKPTGSMQIVDGDASYCVGVKATDFVMNDGTLDITASGNCTRGISADDKLTTNGGTITINSSASGQIISNTNYSPKGMKGENIALNAGTITINTTGTGCKAILAGSGEKSGNTIRNVTGSYTQGTSDGNGPTLTISTTGGALNASSGGGMRPGGGGSTSSSSGAAKGIKAWPIVYIYGGTTEITTTGNKAEGLESKTAVYIEGGKHYMKCYDDCINSAGNIYFNGGITVAYSNGNDAIDSNAGRTGAITIGNGVAFAYTSKGGAEEGFDCDNNSYIQITGTGIGISAGGSQGGGGGGGWGGGSSSSTISNAKQGYYLTTSSISYRTGNYYSLISSGSKNLVTYSFEANVSSNLSLFTATGMVKGSSYSVRYNTTKPTDATTEWHGLYLGSSHTGDSNKTAVSTFTAQ